LVIGAQIRIPLFDIFSNDPDITLMFISGTLAHWRTKKQKPLPKGHVLFVQITFCDAGYDFACGF